MFVAASTECFSELSFEGALQKLVDLEYTSVEIALHEQIPQLQPSAVLADVDAAIMRCRQTHRMNICAFSFDYPGEGELYYRHFAACCKLAKATKVVAMVVPAAELGTPFNAEIERLQQLVSIASLDEVVVGLKTETGKITQDPDTAVVLCGNVKGLGLTLDPSHYVYGPHKGGGYEQVMKHVVHVQLRDSTKTKMQVRVGQGEIEYSRLVAQLQKYHYQRALSVNMQELEGIDHDAEMRKMRLLLESIL